MYKKIMKCAIIPLKSSKIPEIIRVKVWWTGKEKQRVILNLSSSKSLIFSCYIYICTFSNISASFTFSPLISMFSAVKNSCWLNNSIIYQTPSKSFFLSAIPFKNQKHLQCNQLQFSFFLGKYSIYILFSLLQICHIFTCYIMPFCFILQICHIHVLLMNIELKFFIYIYW